MTVYFAIVLFAVLSALTSYLRAQDTYAYDSVSIRSIRNWRVDGIFTFVLLAAVSALRWGIGTDYPMYHRFYELHVLPGEYWGNQETIPQEFGYVWLSTFFKSLNASPEFFLGSVAVVTVLFFFIGIRAASPNVGASLLLFILLCFYTGSFNYVRQGLAMAIIFLAFSLNTKKFFPRLAFILLAATFHATALIAGVVLVLVRIFKSQSGKVLVWSVIGALVTSTMLKIPQVVELLSSINPRYSEYLSDSGDGFGMVFVALSRVLCIGTIFYLVPYREMSTRLKQFTLFAYAGLLLLFVANSMSVLVRFEYYFGMFLVLAVPLATTETKKGKLASVFTCAALGVYFVLHVIRFDGVFPYQSVFTAGVF